MADLLEEILAGRQGGKGAQPSAPAQAPASSLVDEIFREMAAGQATQAGKAVAPTPGVAPVTAGQSLLQGATDPIHGGAQLLQRSLPEGAVNAVNDATAWVNRQPVIGPVTKALGMTPATPQQLNANVAQRETDYQASRQAAGDTGMDWWRVAGGLPGAVGMAAATKNPQTLMGALGQGAATGAATAALQPVPEDQDNYWSQKQGQAVIGAGLGAAGAGLGRAIAPQVDPNVQALRQAGVQLTPGQAVGGAARRVEDAATSIPLVGDVVKGAQRRSLESFNVAAANRALEPLGQSLPKGTAAGREMVQDVAQRVSQAYDDAITQVRPFGPDTAFADELERIGKGFLTPGSKDTFAKALQENVVSRLQGGPVDGATYQTVKSELGRLAADYSGSSTAAERELGRAFGQVKTAMQDLLARQNPDAAPALKAADQAYGGLLRLQDAAGRVGATEGVFTAGQLSGAVRAGDKSLRHGAYARGEAAMQDLSDAGRAVLPSKVPDSGSPLRGYVGVGGLLGAGGQLGVNPAALVTGGLATGAYTPWGARALTGLLAHESSPAVSMLGDTLARGGGPAAVPLGAMLLEPPPRRNRAP